MLLIAGALLVGAAIVVATLNMGASATSSPLGGFLLFFASLLLTLSVPAMYAKQARAAGWPGLAGHALLQLGFLLFLVTTSPHLRNPGYNAPPGGDNAVDGLLAIALALGLLLTGIATVRAGVYPRWLGITLLVATASFFFAFFVAETLPPIWRQASSLLVVLLTLALVGIGASMMREGLAGDSSAPPQALLLPTAQGTESEMRAVR
jgi:hypothetical protein